MSRDAIQIQMWRDGWSVCVCGAGGGGMWRGDWLADLLASEMHNQGDQSINVSLITTTPRTPSHHQAKLHIACPPLHL